VLKSKKLKKNPFELQSLLPSGGDRPQVVDRGGHVRAVRDRLERRVRERSHGRVQPRRGGLERRGGLHGGDGRDRVLDGPGVRRRAGDGIVRLQVGRARALDAGCRSLEKLGDGRLGREGRPRLGDAVKGAGGGRRGRSLEVGPGRCRGLLGVLDAKGDLLGRGAGGARDARGLEVVDGLLDLAEVSL
jgi:hypothetical protein